MAADSQRQFALIGAIVLVGGLGLAWVLRPTAPVEVSEDVTVFAAASLRDVVYEVGSAFSLQQAPGYRVHFNIAGSNVLAQQIMASSQADVFLSANEKWIRHVESAGRLIDGSRRPMLSNRLVVVANTATTWKMSRATDLGGLPFKHLSIGNPDAVPAGIYAKKFLEKTPHNGETLWSTLADRAAPALDVRSALALVEADPSVVGIVYRTDAMASKGVRILFEIPEGAIPPIRYFAARVHRPGATTSAEQFFDFLFSPAAHEIFAKHGFIPSAQGEPAG